MSGSFPIFDAVAQHVIAAIAPAQALDIGAGSGKYGRLLSAAAPGCSRAALEAEPGYVARFNLAEIYHRVIEADADRWWREHEDESFDLVIAGDSLQHLPKSAGLDLLNAMVYRCAWLLVVVPEFVVQGEVDGVRHTVHRSVWSERDFAWHDLWAWDNARSVTFVLLRGYRAAPAGGSATTLDALVQQLNGAHVPLRDYDGQGPVRPCRLRLVDHGREVSYRTR